MKHVLTYFLAALWLQASPLTFTGSDAEGRSAKLELEQVGQQVYMVLTNTSPNDDFVPIDILTAVFFQGGEELVPQAVSLYGPSSVNWGSYDLFGVVGGEWAFACGLWSDPGACGISSAGFGLFGEADRFPGTNLQGPEAPNGLEYGLSSFGDNPYTGDASVTGDFALIWNSIRIVFSLPQANTFSLDKIQEVVFQYGVSIDDPQILAELEANSALHHTPEPATIGMVACGLALLGARQFRRKKI